MQRSIEGWSDCDLANLKLGYHEEWFHHAADDVVAACLSLLASFEERGAKVVKITLPHLDLALIAHLITIASEMAELMQRYGVEFHSSFSLPIRLNIAIAKYFSSSDYLKAQRLRTQMVNYLREIFQEVDAIITPTTAITAPPIPIKTLSEGESNFNLAAELMRFVFLSNLTGTPAISFPAGYSKSGMPIGCQAIGRWWEEKSLFRLSFVSEEIVEKSRPLWYKPSI